MKTLKFKAPFTVPTKDFKGFESMELTVTSTIPESKELSGDPEFKVSIPDYMFDELADTEPKFSTEPDINKRQSFVSIMGMFGEREITRKFKKTQTSKLISQLQEFIGELGNIIVKRHSLETATLSKKIFIKFNHSRNHSTNGLNNAYRGETTSQTFNFFIGYEMYSEGKGFRWSQSGFDENADKPTKRYITKIGYASPDASIQHYNTHFKEKEDLFLDLPGLNQSIENFENEFSIIDWTQEREDFCEKILETFSDINNQLEDFLKDIDSDKIDSLMSSNKFKFLN